MLTWLRSFLYTVVFMLFTLLLGVVCLPALAIGRRAVFACGRFWARISLWLLRVICGVRHEVRGRERWPDLPVIFALKHESAWETIFFLILGPDFAGVLKRELLKIPIYGWYTARLGMIPIDRSAGASALRTMVRRAQEEIDAGRSIMIMPEGTRVQPGETGRFHPGIAALYKALDVPVVPVALNSGLFWHKKGFRKYPGTIVMEFLDPIEPGLERDAFMARLREAIEPAAARLHEEGLKTRR